MSHAPTAMNIELDLDTGERGSRQHAVGSLLAMLCGAEAAIVVNNNAAAVLLVLAAIARDRQVARQSRRERGDRRRVPHPRGDGAIGRAPGRRRHDESHPARRLSQGHQSQELRRRRGAEGAPEQLPSRRVRRGDDRRRTRHARRAGDRRHRQRADRCELPVAQWRTSRMAARRAGRPSDARGRRRARDLQRRQAVRGTAGRRHRRSCRPGEPCATTSAGASPAAGRARDGRDATHHAGLPRQDRSDGDPVLGDGQCNGRRPPHAVRRGSLRLPASARSSSTQAVPGAGSAPGATIPSIGIRLGGDHLAVLRSCDPPIIARARDGSTWLDLRTVDPGSDGAVAAAMRRCA